MRKPFTDYLVHREHHTWKSSTFTNIGQTNLIVYFTKNGFMFYILFDVNYTLKFITEVKRKKLLYKTINILFILFHGHHKNYFF